MTINTHVSIKSFFYPIGNTPAVNLLRDSYSRPDERIKILCVACGDVRNILFTLWSAGPPSQRFYEFTTNDCEPAVLARNVLLFSLLIDQDSASIDSKIIWEIYYHLFITTDALAVLRTQSAKLHEVSTSSAEWRRSPYGKHLLFLDNNTLSMIRQYWQLYRNRQDFSQEYRKSVGKMTAHFKDGLAMQGVRSAGANVFPSVEVLFSSAEFYWETGVVAGCKEDLRALKKSKSICDNPTFACSSAAYGNFAVYRGSNPLLGFHLAEAFDVKKEFSEAVEAVVSLAKSQFQAWCENWKAYFQDDSVIISFCCAEAVGFCYALQEKVIGRSGLSQAHFPYQLPWSSQMLRFEDIEATRTCGPYDIIDTSNLSDNVGTLNLLPAVVPLLRKVAFSTLYIETLLQDYDDLTRYFDEQLHADLTFISVIAGVAPTCCILGTSTEHYGAELVLDAFKDRYESAQFRCRVAWQKPFGGDQRLVELNQQDVPITIVDARKLATLFVEWYVKIFTGFEDMRRMFSKMLNNVQSVRTLTFNRYTRITLVALLSLAKANVITDWSQCMDAFLSGVEQNHSLLVGSNSLQELYVLLHLSELYTVSSMTQNPQAVAAELSPGTISVLPSCLAGFTVLPKIVYVALTVPRKKLEVFTSVNHEEMGNPILRLAVFQNGGFENSFLKLQTCFGKLSFRPEDNTGTIVEDPLGWSGDSDLIAITAMQTFTLLLGKVKETRVALFIQPLSGSVQFMRSLGVHMSVYDASVDNVKNVRVLSTLPGVDKSSSPAPDESSAGTATQSRVQTISLQDGRLKLLTARASIVDKEQRRSLAGGCQLTSSQESPCTVTVKFGSHSHVFLFNLPVDSVHCKTKVSRKNFWIEVAVPISLAAKAKGYSRYPFPTVAHSGISSAWGTSKINLDRQSVVPDMAPMLDLNSILGMTMSQADAAAANAMQSDPLREFKTNIAILIVCFMGQGSPAPSGRFKMSNFMESPRPGLPIYWSTSKSHKLFRLTRGGCADILIFANALRHDADSGSICLDAHVVHLNGPLLSQFHDVLPKLLGGSLEVKISREEEELWKRALPTFVERCRVGWEHGDECEYLVGKEKDRFVCPRSTLHGMNPICSCGEGKDTARLERWYKMFAKHATRVAITPISAVPFVEQMAIHPDPVSESGGQLGARSGPSSKPTTGKATCGHCGGDGGDSSDLKFCAGCRMVKYCGRECQKAAWKEHKAMCLADKK